mgnify:CR=1 FL=1
MSEFITAKEARQLVSESGGFQQEVKLINEKIKLAASDGRIKCNFLVVHDYAEEIARLLESRGFTVTYWKYGEDNVYFRMQIEWGREI